MRNPKNLTAALVVIAGLLIASTARGAQGERITLELEAAPVHQVLEGLAKVLGVQLEAAASDELVTMTVHRVHALTALKAVCESTGCEYTLGEDVLRVEWPGDGGDGLVSHSTLRKLPRMEEKVTLSLRDADLREVLQSFARIVDVELEIDAAVEGQVTVELVAIPAWQAIEKICEVNSLRLEVEEDPAKVRVLLR